MDGQHICIILHNKKKLSISLFQCHQLFFFSHLSPITPSRFPHYSPLHNPLMIVLSLVWNLLMIFYARWRGRGAMLSQKDKMEGVDPAWVAVNEECLHGCVLLRAARWGLVVQTVCGVVGWAWALGFPLLPRWVYTIGVVSAFFSNILTLLAARPIAHGATFLRAATLPGAWFTQLMWLTLPVLPFLVIWVFFTPLPTIAPGLTAMVLGVLPGGLVVLSFVSVLQSVTPVLNEVLGVVLGEDVRVVSMLHRKAGLALPGGKVVRQVSYGVAVRGDAAYVSVLHLADLSVGGATPTWMLRRAIRRRLAQAAAPPDLICLTGSVVAPNFAVLFARKVVLEEVRACLQDLTQHSARIVTFLDETQSTILGTFLEDCSLGVVLRCGESTKRKINGNGVAIAAEGAVLSKAATEGVRLRLLLGADTESFVSGDSADVYHVTLTSSHYGGLVAPSPLPAVLSKAMRAQIPQQGLWGKRGARLHVSPGVGCPGNPPAYPCLRLGAFAALPILQIEVPVC